MKQYNLNIVLKRNLNCNNFHKIIFQFLKVYLHFIKEKFTSISHQKKSFSENLTKIYYHNIALCQN